MDALFLFRKSSYFWFNSKSHWQTTYGMTLYSFSLHDGYYCQPLNFLADLHRSHDTQSVSTLNKVSNPLTGDLFIAVKLRVEPATLCDNKKWCIDMSHILWTTFFRFSFFLVGCLIKAWKPGLRWIHAFS